MHSDRNRVAYCRPLGDSRPPGVACGGHADVLSGAALGGFFTLCCFLRDSKSVSLPCSNADRTACERTRLAESHHGRGVANVLRCGQVLAEKLLRYLNGVDDYAVSGDRVPVGGVMTVW
jgi:hypothetical protein